VSDGNIDHRRRHFRWVIVTICRGARPVVALLRLGVPWVEGEWNDSSGIAQRKHVRGDDLLR